MSDPKPYTEEERAAGLKDLEAKGFPVLDAFSKMTPKMLKTVINMYTSSLAEGAFEYFKAADIEVIYAAVSAVNNCELCATFHALGMAQHGFKQADIDEILAGGLPSDPDTRNLVIATKYALAHKGILLPRERLHLEQLGYAGEKYAELNFLAHFLAANNAIYVNMLNEGLDLEEFLQKAGPYKDSVYKKD